jgi:hypothetical protein
MVSNIVGEGREPETDAENPRASFPTIGGFLPVAPSGIDPLT